MNRKKNYHSLLPLLQHDVNLELVISGRIDDVDYYNDILSQAKKLNVRDQVRLTGQISEQEKSWYFKNCNAFVFPSKAEGFGLPVTEAMSEGKPVFLSSSTALSEIGGEAAFYFSDFTPQNIHEQFDAGMKQYKKAGMKDCIMQRAKDFSWQKAAAAYVGIYRSLY
jgi:glycosyltransferase involved in cell wall biosynthesis